MCPRCGNGDENFLHSVCDCPRALQLWIALGYIDSGFFASTCQEWIRAGSSGTSTHLFLAGLWQAWKDRNEEVIAGTRPDSYQSTREAWWTANTTYKCYLDGRNCDRRERTITWHPLVEDDTVLNADGICLGSPPRVRYGGLLRNGDGH